MATIALLCLVHGDSADHAFPVRIDKTLLIGDLKKEIKKEKAPEFDKFAADKLNLWKVDISYDDEDAVKQLVLKVTNTVKKMSPLSKISKYFGDEPMEEHIHVVIQCPPGK
jgi:Crinkler effector protein N-terminal domain